MSTKDKLPVIKILIYPFDGILHLIEPLQTRLYSLDIHTTITNTNIKTDDTIIVDLNYFTGKPLPLLFELVEYVIQQIPFQFNSLPFLLEGESKILRLLNSKIVVEQFKPTVYSYTHNRYGEVKGTEELRVLFTTEVFRNLNRYSIAHGKSLKNAFLAIVFSSEGVLLVQEKIEACNLEIRVKRYHIGSPVHRYKYTEEYNTVQTDEAPLNKWSRFIEPIVCFDWRHPLFDENGNRLSDEPISDDYASIWMHDVAEGKRLARETFIFLEKLFRDSGFLLVDICFFIDQSGHILYGEISQDCMRVKNSLRDPSLSESMDKDLWRQGEKEELLAERYHNLYQSIFK